ncbi:MAG: carbohydrate porin, partial [Bryobacteraceae bacterium]
MKIPLLILMASLSLAAQTSSDSDSYEDWNLYYQATSIGQDHGKFHSPYSGPLSLQDYPERDVSLTTTLFFDERLGANTQI